MINCKYRNKFLIEAYCENPERREEEGNIRLLRCYMHNCRWKND